MSRQYTPEEDELLKAARPDELQGLAELWGRKRYNLLNRRTRLLRGDDMRTSFHRDPPPKPKPAVRNPLAGRPDWFNDTALLAKMRSGR